MHHSHQNKPSPILEQDEKMLSKEERLRNQELAQFLDHAANILGKSAKLEAQVDVKKMEKKRRNEYLVTLQDYQKHKEVIVAAIILWWLVTIVLGLVAMTVESIITDIAMFVIWAGLLLSNIAFVVGYRMYDGGQQDKIVREYQVKVDIIVANPLALDDDKAVREDRVHVEIA